MSDLHRARARAEAFAHAVDHGPRHSSRLSDDPELATAVELVGRLRTAGAVAPRPEFTAELRHRLLEQAAARAATTPTVVRSGLEASDELPPREDDASVTDIGHRQRRRISLVASTAALVLLGGGIGSAAAAQQAMPGDALYGMKRGIENVSTNVSVGDDSRGRRELGHAMTRLAEVDALLKDGGDVETINRTLDDFSVQARRGVSRLVAAYQQNEDKSAIVAVTTFITDARQALADLAPRLPAESLKQAVQALATIGQLADHAAGACTDCDKPKPVKSGGPTRVNGGGSEPTTVPGGGEASKGGPSSMPTTFPSLNTSPGVSLATSAPTKSGEVVTQSTPTPTPIIPSVDLTGPTTTPSPSGTTKPPTGTHPTLPTPTLPTTPWTFPFPTLSIPNPLCLPLLPPCR